MADEVQVCEAYSCERPVSTLVAAVCMGCGEQHTAPLCARCARQVTAAMNEQRVDCRLCGDHITLVEAADVVPVDPGPAYADMLRGL